MISAGILRGLLGALLAFMSLCALGGGIYGLMGAEGVPAVWLEGSPFTTYLIPSLFLFAAVGGSCALAAWAVLMSHRLGRILAPAAGVLLIAWIAAQVSIIGYVSWLQPFVAAYGIIVIIVSNRISSGGTA
jgi:hypothetical protein